MNRSGLIALRNGVKAYADAYNAALPVGWIPMSVAPVGWKERPKQGNVAAGGGNRVVFIPGDPTSGRGGTLEKPRHHQLNPRELVGWRRLVTMSVWGVDHSSPAALNDEQAQLEAAETVLEQAMQAVHAAVDPSLGVNVGLADVVWGDVNYTVPPVELAFGKELVATFTYRSIAAYAPPVGIAYPQAGITRNPES